MKPFLFFSKQQDQRLSTKLQKGIIGEQKLSGCRVAYDNDLGKSNGLPGGVTDNIICASGRKGANKSTLVDTCQGITFFSN
jgi:hypothetical protein